MRLKPKIQSKWAVVAVSVWLLLWLSLLNPSNSRPLWLLVPFVLIIFLVYRLLGWLISRLSSNMGARQKVLVWFASLLIGLLLIFSSLGQLGWRDGLTLLALAVLGLVYIVKLIPAKP